MVDGVYQFGYGDDPDLEYYADASDTLIDESGLPVFSEDQTT